MEDEVRKELETLQGMVLNWKNDYLGWAPPDGGGEFLARELAEEIETHVLPYVRRMHQCDYLSRHEMDAFLEDCFGQVEDLRRKLEESGAAGRTEKEGGHA